jgi:hypothetical protein
MYDAISYCKVRTLRNARDSVEASASFFRPIGYFLDVEELVRAGMVTARGNSIALTPLGSSRLAGDSLVSKPSWS